MAYEARKFNSIQSMRALAALSVVFEHIGMIRNGAFGVDLFFCISGFIMMYSTEKSGRHFLQKRFIRIIPLYWIATLLMTAILFVLQSLSKRFEFDIIRTIKSMLFIPYFFYNADGSLSHSVVHPGWTLILEMFYYLLFFISMKINHKYRNLICTGLLIVLVIIGAVFHTDNTFIKFYARPIILEFALGMLAFKALSKSTNKVKKTSTKAILVSLAVFIWAGLFAVRPFDQIDNFIKFGLPSFVFFIIVFKAFEDNKVPRFFIMLGNISYSLYLTHIFVVFAFNSIIYDMEVFSYHGLIVAIFIFLPISIGVAWMSWYIIENKFTKWAIKALRI